MSHHQHRQRRQIHVNILRRCGGGGGGGGATLALVSLGKQRGAALRGLRLYAPRWKLPSLPSDEFYHADLVGLPVYDGGGAKLGKVRAVHDFGAGDILEIVSPEFRQPVMLPFTRAAVPIVDLAAHRIVADPPPGVFPGDDGDDDDDGAPGPGEDDARDPGA